jgi:excisionase family DNA binding protein
MDRRLCSVDEAASYLGLKKSTLYAWARRRQIPSVKIGRRLLFDQEDLDSLIESEKRRVEVAESFYAMMF